jgi:putative ABC transport system permease protein
LRGPTTLVGRGPASHVLAIPVSSNFFDMLGVKAGLGRVFVPTDENRGCTVVLSHAFWETKLSSDAHIVGESLGLSTSGYDASCLVVGVMPAGFAFYPAATALWRLDAKAMPAATGIFGRLKSGVTREQAEAELASLSRAVHPGDEWKTFVPSVYDLQGEFTFLAGRNLQKTLWLLLGAVALVLMIGCVNVANMLMGRSALRSKEFAIRAALGGGRGRLTRQLVTEGLLLSLAGGAGGVLLAQASIDGFLALSPVELPVGTLLTLNVPVLLFALATSVVTAVLFSLAPAWRGSRASLNTRGSTGGRGQTARILVTAEMALSVLLLAGAGLLLQSVARMGAAPLGFQPERLYTLRLSVPKEAAFYDQLEARAAAIPGIQSVALATAMPPFDGGSEVLDISGRTPVERHDVAPKRVSPSYFRTMEVAVERGRLFDSHDRAGAEPVAVINHALAQEYFPGTSPLGQRLRVGKDEPLATVIGVVADEKHTNVMQEMRWIDVPVLYRPLAQSPAVQVSIAIRAVTDSLPLEAALRKEITTLEPNAVVDEVESMRHQLGRFLAYPRFRAALITGFAVFALLLAAVGLHGVLAQEDAGNRSAYGPWRETRRHHRNDRSRERSSRNRRSIHRRRVGAIDDAIPFRSPVWRGSQRPPHVGHGMRCPTTGGCRRDSRAGTEGGGHRSHGSTANRVKRLPFQDGEEPARSIQ